MTFTMEQLNQVFDEMERRLSVDIDNGVLRTDREIRYARNDMLQGVYGTLMVLADNWSDVRQMIDRIEIERCYDESPLTLMAIAGEEKMRKKEA